MWPPPMLRNNWQEGVTSLNREQLGSIRKMSIRWSGTFHFSLCLYCHTLPIGHVGRALDPEEGGLGNFLSTGVSLGLTGVV